MNDTHFFGNTFMRPLTSPTYRRHHILRTSMSARYIYILGLEAGRFYVGETDNVERRVQEHIAGGCSLESSIKCVYPGAAWTAKYKVKHLLSTRKSTGPTAEDAAVKELMLTHGIEKVRGGSYSNILLTKTQIDALKTELWGAAGKCFRCGRSSHWIKTCRAKTDINGSPIYEVQTAAPKAEWFRMRESIRESTYLSNLMNALGSGLRDAIEDIVDDLGD